jgi:spermidine synthase
LADRVGNPLLEALAGILGVGATIALGQAAWSFEVVWSQAVGQFVSTRAFAFSIVLAVYLAGLALGSWLSSRLAWMVREGWGAFGALITGAALVAVLEFAFIGRWLVELQMWVGEAVKSATGSQALMMYATFLLAGLGIVFVPTTLLGAAFPMALRLAVGGTFRADVSRELQGVGRSENADTDTRSASGIDAEQSAVRRDHA